MDIKNCPGCGRVFLDSGSGVCPQCLEEEDRQFEIVRRYVDEHPNSLVDEVSEETGVAKELIVKFLRIGRLTQGSVRGFEPTCEVCGAVIRSGRVCGRCMDAFARASQAPGAPSPKSQPVRQGGQRFHIYDTIRKSGK